jgi:tRNA A37 threonylcarbamoyladenosine dehydratase
VSDFESRFGGIQRLYGREGLSRLRSAHVAVVGVGGVGSWAVEALARSAVGKITLIDADEVCVSNVNRQLPALDGEIGAPKVVALARRMRAITPDIAIDARQEFFTAENAQALFSLGFAHVIDAIDTLTHKAVLIAEAHRRNLGVITSGGAGGRIKATSVRIDDLAKASHDPLLQKLRRTLRAEFGFSRDPKSHFGIPAVFTPELATAPEACDAGEQSLRMDCNSGYGAVSFVTGVFGFAAAGWVVNRIARGE